jgi:hypothetical protein
MEVQALQHHGNRGKNSDKFCNYCCHDIHKTNQRLPSEKQMLLSHNAIEIEKSHIV